MAICIEPVARSHGEKIKTCSGGLSESSGPDGERYLRANQQINTTPPEVTKSKSHARKWSKGVDRTMQDSEFDRFMAVIQDPRHKIAFKMQAFLGLRVSEVCVVNEKDFDLQRRTFRRWNVKRKHWITMPMPPLLHNALLEYLAIEGDAVKKHEGYLLYSPRPSKLNPKPYVSVNYLRKIFKEYTAKAGLNDYYMEVRSSGLQPGKTRKLYRLSTHSLRHYFGAQTYKASRDLVLVSKLLDHTRIDVTTTYLDSAGQRAKEIMDKAFGEYTEKDNLAEFKELYVIYRQMKNGGGATQPL